MMNADELDTFLRTNNKIELEQLSVGQNVSDDQFVHDVLNKMDAQTPAKDFTMPESFFFKRNDIYISKHNRYAEQYAHKHDFLEINYMYSGTSTHTINNTDNVTLNTGDLIIFDKGSSHSIRSLGENDILVNILLKFNSLNTRVIRELIKNQSITNEFAIAHQNQNQNYFVIRNNNSFRIRTLLILILTDYFDKKNANNSLVSTYIPVLLSEIARSFHVQPHKEDKITKILTLIESQYTDITLTSLASQLGFSSGYLSSFISKTMNATFKDLLRKQRLKVAYSLVVDSTYPIDEIANIVGFDDPSYFFRIFKKEYNLSPGKIRKAHFYLH